MYEPSFLSIRVSLVDARFLKVGIGLSLLLHLAVLAIPAGKPPKEGLPGQRLSARLMRLPARAHEAPAAPAVASPQPERGKRRQKGPAVLAMPQPKSAPQAPLPLVRPSNTLEGTAPEAQRPAVAPLNLAMNALAMARAVGRQGGLQHQWDGDAIERLPNSPEPDAMGLELYFDALVKKLNRSAAFAPNQKVRLGTGTAAIRVKLNPDGSLQDLDVLQAADQAEEIERIKSIVTLAVPFPAFPPDLKRSASAVSMMICVKPARDGAGFGFSRDTSGRKGC